MIDFTHIGDFSRRYFVYNLYLKFFHNHLYYRKLYVVNRENIPAKGKPVLVIYNHQNGVNDPLNILYMFDDFRQPVFIARGDIFKKDRVAKILRFLKILPTFRSRDGGVSDVKYNMTSFNLAAKVLNNGGTLVIAPEAQHQQGRYLGSFKKGFPRIAFAAEDMADFKLDLQILPVNIHYKDYYNARTEVVLTVGEPFGCVEFAESFKTDPNIAYGLLNEKARARLKAITPDIEAHEEYYEEIDLLRRMWVKSRLEAKGKSTSYFPNYPPEEVVMLQEISAMQQQKPQEFSDLMQTVREYLGELQKLNLKDWVIGRKVSLAKVSLYTLAAVLAFPFYLFGLINNIIPFYIPSYLRRNIKDRQLHASFHFVGALVFFTIYYLLVFAIIWIATKSILWALVYMVAMFVSFFLFYGYKKGFVKLKALWRYYQLCRAGQPQRAMKLKEKLQICQWI
ncbi:MAG: 1-acyl-sn-glycerol-3-phosphate acyltransferase [Bacteroidales bacterium]|nr:1-acyl-sn-glycerol-3-phosphate acyltransferase [Bacteroidales bacterium]